MTGWISPTQCGELVDVLLERGLRHISDRPPTPRQDDPAEPADLDITAWRLLAAQHRVINARRLLDDPRIGVDLTTLTRGFDALADKAGDVRDVVREADNAEIPVHRGDTPDMITTAVYRRRAAVVDAELAPLPLPAPEAPTWTVRYDKHGGFVATVTSGRDDVGPHRGWGYASTPQSAIATVTGFTAHRPPAVVLDPPPPTPVRLAELTSEADTSVEGQRVAELLIHRGSAYQEHLEACRRAAHILRGTDIGSYLEERARLLNDTAPQLEHADILFDAPTAANKDHHGYFDTTLWVPTRLVVSTACPTWGDFQGHRQYMLREIAQGLADAADLDAFTTELFTDQIHLTHTPAWAGPVYQVSANGNHRVHVARMLELPWLATTVTYEQPPPAWPSWAIYGAESDWAKTGWSKKWAQQRQDLIEGLIRRGIIDGEFDDTPELFNRTLHCTRLPAPWLIRAPELATAANAYYEGLYPGALAMLGIPTDVGTDAHAWTRWLTSARGGQ